METTNFCESRLKRRQQQFALRTNWFILTADFWLDELCTVFTHSLFLYKYRTYVRTFHELMLCPNVSSMFQAVLDSIYIYYKGPRKTLTLLLLEIRYCGLLSESKATFGQETQERFISVSVLNKILSTELHVWNHTLGARSICRVLIFREGDCLRWPNTVLARAFVDAI